MSGVVLVTAGHVDHGKTALVAALTGIDADRLPEERRRGMTIDIGYAHLPLETGDVIDFVDVPGHEDLLPNMIVGALQADGFTLVVDAAEGIRPQTIEHLEVLEAVGLWHGTAVVTKSDLVTAAVAEAAANDVKRRLAETIHGPSEVTVVSSRTGAGLGDLRRALTALHLRIRGDSAAPSHRIQGSPVLLIDRAFTVDGRGTVVTGTLRGGHLADGQTLTVEPLGRQVRVVELQRHGRRLRELSGSGRIAVRLRGTRREELQRGMALTGSTRIWRGGHVLALMPLGCRAARPGSELVVHAGTDQVAAVVRRTWPTPTGHLARLALRRRAAFVPGAPILFRRPRHDSRVHRAIPLAVERAARQLPRLSAEQADAIAAVALDGAMGLVRAIVELAGAVPASEIDALIERNGNGAPPTQELAIPAGHLRLSQHRADALDRCLKDLAIASGDVGFSFAEGRARLAALLRPHGEAIAAEAAETFLDASVRRGDLRRCGNWLFERSRYELPVSAGGAALLAILSSRAPPPLPDAIRAAGCASTEALALERRAAIVRVSDWLAYSAGTYRELTGAIAAMAQSRHVTPAEVRDALGGSRRYALALLEHLDAKGTLTRNATGHVLRTAL